VENPHGDNSVEWIKEGTSVSFYAKEMVPIVDEKRVKKRDVFQYWSVNGRPNKNNVLTFIVDKPYVAKACYEREEEYKIKVDSDYGHPTMDEPSGWYKKGEEATISVEPEVPLEGWKGAWGGKRVFTAWRSEEGLESRNPAYTFEVDGAKNFKAEWEIDDSKPMMYLRILIAAVTSAAVTLTVFLLYRTGWILQQEKKAKPAQEAEEKHRPGRFSRFIKKKSSSISSFLEPQGENIYLEVSKYEEFLHKLEEAYKSNQVTEYMYKKLKDEYLAKIKELKGA
jgi:hypothetical protein